MKNRVKQLAEVTTLAFIWAWASTGLALFGEAASGLIYAFDLIERPPHWQDECECPLCRD